MICPDCGRKNPDRASRCSGCSTFLGDRSLAPTRMGVGDSGSPAPPVSLGEDLEESATIVSDALSAGTRNRLESQYEALSPGASIGSRYEIVSVLGMGGMGVVYRARDLKLERDVALKVIRPEMAQLPDVMERFRREILLASKVTHKNVLRIHDLGEADGISYISMDFVEGETLRDVLEREGALEVERALPLAIQMCHALQAAHDAGVVHRDLKPGNILLDQEGNTYIADFGLSRSVNTGETMTQAGMILGTIDYMSPEQARGETPDHRGDLYSFGIILYEMLTGSLPFRTENALTSMVRRVHEDAPRVRQVRPRTPPWLSAIVQRALQRSPDARYQSASELLADIQKQRASLAWRRFTRPKVLLRAGVVLLAVALVLLGLGIGVRTLLRDRASAPAAVAPKASLALLPFRNTTGDPGLDWTQTGLPDLLRTDLQQGRALRLVGEDRVRGVLDGLKIGDRGEFRDEDLRRLAGLLDAENLLTGSLTRAGDRFRIEVRLRRALGDQVTPGQVIRVEGTGAESIFSMVDELTARLRDELGVAVGWGERDLGVTELSTDSVEALRLYQDGLSLSRSGNHMEAAERLEAALQEDPGFGFAGALLADTYMQLGYADKAAQAAERAAEALSGASPFEAARIRAARARIGNDLDAAEEAYRGLVELAPADTEAHFQLASVLEQQGDFEGALESFRRVIELDPKHADGHFALGRVQAKRGSPEEALAEFNAALGLHLESGNEEGRATVLNALGYAYEDLGQNEQAMQYFQDSLQIRRRIGDRRGVASTLNNIAVILTVQGRYEEAIDMQNQALEIGREIGDRAGMARWYSNLGDTYQEMGRPEKALASYQESLKIIRETGSAEGLAWNLSNIGYINTSLGNYLEAYFFQKEALEKSRESGDNIEILLSLIGIGSAEQIQGRYEEAIRYALEGLELARQLGIRDVIAVLQANLSNIQEDQGEYGSALASLQEAVSIAREMGDQGLLATCLGYLGRVRTRIGDLDGAGESLDEALRLMTEMNNRTGVAEIQVHRGALLLARGEPEAAKRALTTALAEAESARHHRFQLLARLQLAILEGSAAQLQAVREEARSSGLAPLVGPASLSLARLHLEAGRLPQAQEAAEEALGAAGPLRQRDILLQAGHLAGAALEAAGSAAAAANRYVVALEALEEMRDNLRGEPLATFLARPETADLRSAAAALRSAGRSAEADRLEAALRP